MLIVHMEIIYSEFYLQLYSIYWTIPIRILVSWYIAFVNNNCN